MEGKEAFRGKSNKITKQKKNVHEKYKKLINKTHICLYILILHYFPDVRHL